MSAHLFRWWVALGAAFIVGGLGYGLRPVEAQEPRQERRETMAEVIGAVVEACLRGGGTWVNGVEDGVVVGRCYPLPNVGVMAVTKGGRK